MFAPTAADPYSALACKELLDQAQVSAHYLIDREGFTYQLVAENDRAWHAGVSKMPASERCGVNDFSIGVELIGFDSNGSHVLSAAHSQTVGFTESQYQALGELTRDLLKRFPIHYIVGHSAIAPD